MPGSEIGSEARGCMRFENQCYHKSGNSPLSPPLVSNQRNPAHCLPLILKISSLKARLFCRYGRFFIVGPGNSPPAFVASLGVECRWISKFILDWCAGVRNQALAVPVPPPTRRIVRRHSADDRLLAFARQGGSPDRASVLDGKAGSRRSACRKNGRNGCGIP